MVTTVKKGHGGARPGAGKPRKTLSQQRIDDLLKLGKRYKKEQGKTPEELLMDIMYGLGDFREASIVQRNKAIDTYLRHTMPTQSEQNVNVTKAQAPAIYLPEQKPDPAMVVPTAEDADERAKPN